MGCSSKRQFSLKGSHGSHHHDGGSPDAGGGKKKASRIKWRPSKGGIKEREDTRPDNLLPRKRSFGYGCDGGQRVGEQSSPRHRRAAGGATSCQRGGLTTRGRWEEREGGGGGGDGLDDTGRPFIDNGRRVLLPLAADGRCQRTIKI